MPANASIEAPFAALSECSLSEQLGAEISELCGYLNAATAHLLELIRRFDEQRGWEQAGFPSCAHWLHFHCGFGMNAARERVRVAHALTGLPKISAEFSAGRLSFSKVRAMTRIDDPRHEDFLLMIARHGTASHLERLVSGYRRIERLNDPAQVEADYQARELTYFTDEDGSLVIKARLPAETGALFVKALDRALEAQFAGREADAGDLPPVAARRADAVGEIAETYLNHPENSGNTADRFQVLVHANAGNVQPDGMVSVGDVPSGRTPRRGDLHHVSAETARLDRGPHVSAVTPRLDHGPHVSAETSRRLGCDCSVSVIHEDRNGEPLSIGRRSRTIPPAMRRALVARDGGCRFPGCQQHRFCDGHHVEHWADGGETSLDNLVLLCRFHHRLVHEGGFDCRKSANGEIYFVDARERRLGSRPPLDPVTAAASLGWLHRRFAAAGIDASTCKSEWHAGETMDWDFAFKVMLQ